ncbi:MAG: hypothetical protein AAB035_02220 [Nitrospirota bacterium]
MTTPCFAAGQTAAINAPQRDNVVYEITATYNEKKHQIEGVAKIIFTHTGETPLSEIYLFLYPNLYRDPDSTKKKEEEYRLAYPIRFNPGAMEILSVKDEKDQLLVASDFFCAKGLSEIRLITPIAPKTSTTISIQFATKIPERYGVFGYFRDWVTLQGGWYPYLPTLLNGKWDLHALPKRSAFRLALTLPEAFSPIATIPLVVQAEKEGMKQWIGEGDSIMFMSLSFGKNEIEKKKEIGPVTLHHLFSKKNKIYGEQIFDATERAVLFFLSQWDSFPKTSIQLSQAALYRDIVTTGENLLYLDAKLFKVFPKLKKFHEVRVAKGVFRLLWEKLLPWESPWALEIMAAVTAEEFMDTVYPNPFELKNGLKSISFFPFVDQILYSDDLILRQIYFGKVVSEQETLYAFHQSVSPRLPQLRKLLTPHVLETIINDYKDHIQLGAHPSFKSLLLEHNKKMEQFFEAEHLLNVATSERKTDDISAIDFSIEKVTREKVAERLLQGEIHQTTVELQKKGAMVEPVEIVFDQKNGEKILLIWDGKENRQIMTMTTDSPILVVTIDPEEITGDRNRGNNRNPIPWKVLLARSDIDYNLTTHFLGFDMNLQFQPVYSEKNKINIGFLHGDTRDVGSLQYSHVLLNQQSVSVGVAHQSPRKALSVLDRDEVTASFSYALGDAPIPFVRQYTQWLTGRYPEWNMTLRYDQSLTGNDHDSVTYTTFRFRRAFVFSNYHQIQTRFLAGGSTGSLFQNSRFFLGGQSGMRGYTPLRFEGDNISLFSLGYQFPILYETDLNLLGLALAHTLQGAIFTDWGMVGPRSDLLRSDQYKSDVGLGFRWFIDFLGVVPMTFGFDVAWPIDSPIESEKKPHYYLSGGRLF